MLERLVCVTIDMHYTKSIVNIIIYNVTLLVGIANFDIRQGTLPIRASYLSRVRIIKDSH